MQDQNPTESRMEEWEGAAMKIIKREWTGILASRDQLLDQFWVANGERTMCF